MTSKPIILFPTLVHIGFRNYLAVDDILAIAAPKSSPIKRAIRVAEDKEMVIDLTGGHRTKAVIFTDSGRIVLSFLDPATIDKRIKAILPYVSPTEKEG